VGVGAVRCHSAGLDPEAAVKNDRTLLCRCSLRARPRMSSE
jgi:hypothetical protein